ncbi:MAG: hypothetical protein LiPW41_496 [Parcubacteria group bacterium LiPW_41]|nr:MAG: hypothetical protein LiPW41_496 [Parcubacteria group bacterium LiPW_41]
MYWFIIIAMFTTLSLVCFLGTKFATRNNQSTWGGWGIAFLVFSGISLIISIPKTLNGYSDQIENKENYTRLVQVENVFQKRAETLTKEFSNYLGDAYPKHERSIFDKMKPESINLYLVKYPEIQASKTVMALVDNIKGLRDSVYSKQIARADLLKDMRYRAKNPWIIQWGMPEVEIPEK